jgi:hypothetical protein
VLDGDTASAAKPSKSLVIISEPSSVEVTRWRLARGSTSSSIWSGWRHPDRADEAMPESMAAGKRRAKFVSSASMAVFADRAPPATSGARTRAKI